MSKLTTIVPAQLDIDLETASAVMQAMIQASRDLHALIRQALLAELDDDVAARFLANAKAQLQGTLDELDSLVSVNQTTEAGTPVQTVQNDVDFYAWDSSAESALALTAIHVIDIPPATRLLTINGSTMSSNTDLKAAYSASTTSRVFAPKSTNDWDVTLITKMFRDIIDLHTAGPTVETTRALTGRAYLANITDANAPLPPTNLWVFLFKHATTGRYRPMLVEPVKGGAGVFLHELQFIPSTGIVGSGWFVANAGVMPQGGSSYWSNVFESPVGAAASIKTRKLSKIITDTQTNNVVRTESFTKRDEIQELLNYLP